MVTRLFPNISACVAVSSAKYLGSEAAQRLSTHTQSELQLNQCYCFSMFNIVLDLPSDDNSERISKRMSSGISRQRYRAADWQAWQKDPYLRPWIIQIPNHLSSYLSKSHVGKFTGIYLPSCTRKLVSFYLGVETLLQILVSYCSQLGPGEICKQFRKMCKRENSYGQSVKVSVQVLRQSSKPSNVHNSFWPTYSLQGENVWIPLAKPANLKR